MSTPATGGNERGNGPSNIRKRPRCEACLALVQKKASSSSSTQKEPRSMHQKGTMAYGAIMVGYFSVWIADTYMFRRASTRWHRANEFHRYSKAVLLLGTKQ
jgi:hypothetical protein